jgi:hypothetical protein
MRIPKAKKKKKSGTLICGSRRNHLKKKMMRRKKMMKMRMMKRVLLEVKAIVDTVAMHSRCKECGGPIDVSMKTVCLATKLIITCKDQKCGYIHHSESPAEADLGEKIDNRERTTDYAVNVLYVLGFITCGDGGAEAARMLGLIGLPNETTMETRSFQIVEERISPMILKLHQEILLENLIEEVKETDMDPNDFMLWEQSLQANATFELSKSKYPQLQVSFDMGWQQRSSGHRYNSRSGHAMLVGSLTCKPLSLVIKSKICNFCKAWKKRDNPYELEVPKHTCLRNHEGLSGAMEPASCLEMTVDLYNTKHCIVESICADDDASTKSLVRWSNADFMKNHNTSAVPRVFVSRGPNKGVIVGTTLKTHITRSLH